MATDDLDASNFRGRCKDCGRSGSLDYVLYDFKRDYHTEKQWISVNDYIRGDVCGKGVRIRLRDGSELEGAIPQTNGDWWWGNRFFTLHGVTHVKVEATHD